MVILSESSVHELSVGSVSVRLESVFDARAEFGSTTRKISSAVSARLNFSSTESTVVGIALMSASALTAGLNQPAPPTAGAILTFCALAIICAASTKFTLLNGRKLPSA